MCTNKIKNYKDIFDDTIKGFGVFQRTTQDVYCRNKPGCYRLTERANSVRLSSLRRLLLRVLMYLSSNK